jgi:hypothetical protein
LIVAEVPIVPSATTRIIAFGAGEAIAVHLRKASANKNGEEEHHETHGAHQ